MCLGVSSFHPFNYVGKILVDRYDERSPCLLRLEEEGLRKRVVFTSLPFPSRFENKRPRVGFGVHFYKEGEATIIPERR